MAAETAAAESVSDGMVVGLGTGRTANYAIRKLASMASSGISLICIPTSDATSLLARKLGLTVSTMDEYPDITVTIDGADAVDPSLNMIKGRGGALLREKIVASASKMEVIVADEAKIVKFLGMKEPLPVEIVRFGYRSTMASLTTLGCEPVLRAEGGKPFVTDSTNYIADCRFGRIDDPAGLNAKINTIPGVVENGLFAGIASVVYVGGANGVRIMRK